MKRFLLPLGLFAMALVAHAQEQEEGLLGRIDANWRKGLKAMDANSKYDPSLTNPLQKKNFAGTAVETKKYDAGAFQGTKSAEVKAFGTRSFFGIKNPWFGRRVFDTNSSAIADREASEAGRDFRAGSYAVNGYSKAGKKDEIDGNAVLPDAAKPRKFLDVGQPRERTGIDRFTQNLRKDLSIDDVRDLLNKGKSQ